MKKMMIAFGVAALSVCAFAGPHGCGPCHPHRPGGWHPGPAPHHYHGPGREEAFWGGVVGGLVGGAVAATVARPAPVVVTQPAVVTTPVVVTQPTVVSQPVVSQTTVVSQPATSTQSVWVEGRYVDSVQANGSVVRTWQPGHYEQRTVVVQ